MESKEKNGLKRLMNVIKKNSLGMVLILFLFILCGYFYSYNMVVPKYKSISTILLTSDNVNKDMQSVTQNDINLNKSLIATYGKILKSNNVLNKVIERLNLNMTYQELYANVEIEEVTNTQMIKISVINTNSLQAQKIAEALNQVFMEEIKEFYKVDNVSIVDTASLETTPYNINHKRDIMLFFMAGTVLNAIMISVIYILDTTVKIEQDLEEYVGINVIGSVPLHKSRTEEELIVQSSNKSVVAEAFKTIRTNISFLKSKEESKTILFTSCNSSEGKSWIAANMAVACAWSNKNVIIVDADMRKGRQHNIFRVSNENGLSDCLREIENNEDYENLKRYIKQTNMPKVHIMTIGTLPPNPSELLASNKMNDLIHMLKCVYDVVIIDGTPCSLVSDSIPVARIVDSTILVAECRRTKIEDLKNVIKLIKNVDGHIEGAILNKKEIRNKEYGKGYYYGKVDNEAKLELEIHTVQELIENRKEHVTEEVEVEESVKKDRVQELIEKIESLEEKLLKIPDMNLASYTKAVEDIRKIYENEIDKNKLAENIKDNIVKNEVIKKLEKSEIETKNVVEQSIKNIEETVKDMISDLKGEQSENTQETGINERLNDILEKIEQITQAHEISNNEQIIVNTRVEEKLTEANNKMEEMLEETNSIVKEKLIEANNRMEQMLEGTNNIVEEKLAETNSKVGEMLEGTNNIVEEKLVEANNKVEEKITEVNSKIEEKLEEVIETIKTETQKKLEKLDNETQIAEIKEELRQMNDRYTKLVEEISKNIADLEKKQEMVAKPITSKNNVIELEKAKRKLNKQEITIEYGDEIAYEQLLDLAIDVIELKGNDNTVLERKAE